MGDWIQLSWFKKPNYTDRRGNLIQFICFHWILFVYIVNDLIDQYFSFYNRIHGCYLLYEETLVNI